MSPFSCVSWTMFERPLLAEAEENLRVVRNPHPAVVEQCSRCDSRVRSRVPCQVTNRTNRPLAAGNDDRAIKIEGEVHPRYSGRAHDTPQACPLVSLEEQEPAAPCAYQLSSASAALAACQFVEFVDPVTAHGFRPRTFVQP